MENSSTVTEPPRVPRYVRDLNELANVRGITTSTLFGPDENHPETRLWSIWTGDFHQLQSVGLLARHQIARLMNPIKPSRRGRHRMLTVPGSEPPWCNPLLQGEIEVAGDRFRWRLDFGSAVFSIANRGWGDVEAITCANEVRLYGSAEALVRVGLDEARLPVGARTARSSGWAEEPWWHIRRVPSGLYLYRYATENLSRSRHSQAQGDYTSPVRTRLTLVVDNTPRDR
jgi:hypothetical protein